MIVRETNVNILITSVSPYRFLTTLYHYPNLPFIPKLPIYVDIFNDFTKLLLHYEFIYSGTLNPYLPDDELEAEI